MTEMFVRVKPYNEPLKQLVRRYVYNGVRFEEGKGWYSVPAATAEYLKTVKPNATDPLAPFVFDVCTKAEAEVLERKDYETAHPERKISEALTGAQKVTTAMLAKGSDEPVPVEPEPTGDDTGDGTGDAEPKTGDDTGDADPKTGDEDKGASPFA